MAAGKNNNYSRTLGIVTSPEDDELQRIKKRFQCDWDYSVDTRREAVNDLFFSRVSQWDDWLSQYVTLQYRGQFDIVRPVVRKLVAEMRQNPIQVRYRPKDGANPDAADTLQGMYRADVRGNSAIGAINVAVREQLEAGFGAWRWITEYEDDNPLSNTQRARRVPIHEAADHVIWDSASIQMDKSDAKHVTILTPYTRDSWAEFADSEGIDTDFPTGGLNKTSGSFDFPWVNRNVIQVGEFYERKQKRQKVVIYEHPETQELIPYYKKDIKEVESQLEEMGYTKVGERTVTRYEVYKTIFTGTKILKKARKISGQYLPVVPCYG